MRTLDYSRTPGDSYGFYRDSLAYSGTSDYWLLKAGIARLAVAVHPDVGQTARVEFTLSDPALVAGGTARWIVWPSGNVTSGRADELSAMVTAIRGVTSGGTATMEVVAT